MKQRIVCDGGWRLQQHPDRKARLRLLRESVEARYSAERARAGFLKRMVLRWRMEKDYRRAVREIGPSQQALY